MKNQIRATLSGLGLTLLASLMLASCGNQEKPAATNPDTTATSSPASAANGSDPYANIPTSSAKNTGDGTKAVIPASAKSLGVEPTGETACPSNAPVKGKVTQKRGNIYHAPKSPDFDKVKPDICFKDTATAEKAGFSLPK